MSRSNILSKWEQKFEIGSLFRLRMLFFFLSLFFLVCTMIPFTLDLFIKRHTRGYKGYRTWKYNCFCSLHTTGIYVPVEKTLVTSKLLVQTSTSSYYKVVDSIHSLRRYKTALRQCDWNSAKFLNIEQTHGCVFSLWNILLHVPTSFFFLLSSNNLHHSYIALILRVCYYRLPPWNMMTVWFSLSYNFL